MLAISVLAPSSSYIFLVFFKLWVGIIVFGMSNGFFLLPVIMSLIGPVEEKNQKVIEIKPIERKARKVEELS